MSRDDFYLTTYKAKKVSWRIFFLIRVEFWNCLRIFLEFSIAKSFNQFQLPMDV